MTSVKSSAGQLKKLRSAILKCRRDSNSRRPHFSPDVKDLARQLVKDGLPMSQIVSETGISATTLYGWLSKKKRMKPGFDKLAVVSDHVSQRQASTAVIILPSGIRIEVT